MARFAFFALAVLVSACGARSQLGLPSGTGGSAGNAGTSGVGGTSGFGGTPSGGGGTPASGGTSGSGGISGSGGASGSGGSVTGTTCFGIASLASRLVDAPANHHQRAPRLALSSADLSRVTLAYRRVPAQGQGPIGLAQVEFDAWGDWPAAPLGQASPLYQHGGTVFRVAPAFGDHFALFSDRWVGGAPVGLGLATNVTPGTAVNGELQFETSADLPELLARGANDHLFGFVHGAVGHFMLNTGREPDFNLPVLAASGCATNPIRADAVYQPGRYFVAYSTSRDFESCLNDDGVDGPVNRFQVALVPDAGQPSLAFEWGDAVDQIALVPRSDGVWVVWQPKAVSVQSPIFGARLGLDGVLLTLPNSFTGTEQSFLPFAVDRLGDDLALAWLDTLDPSEPSIRIQLFDQNATNDPHLEFTLQPAPDEWPSGPLSLLGSPDGMHLLVSWQAQNGSGHDVVVTRRLDCVVPD